MWKTSCIDNTSDINVVLKERWLVHLQLLPHVLLPKRFYNPDPILLVGLWDT